VGYDVSYHPFADHVFENQFLPYVLGEKSLSSSMRDTAKQRALTRYRANAWGLACARAMREDDALAAATGFDSDLHVWGRPFFIVGPGFPDTSRDVDAYIACKGIAQVDDLARAQLERLQPGLSLRVAPLQDEAPPTDEQIEAMVFQKPGILRDAVAALRRGEAVTLPNGNERDPAEVLAAHLPYVALQFCSHFQPGWMDRGPVAPSMVLSDMGYGKAVAHFFSSPALLFESATKALPGVEFGLPNTIAENYSLGGCVPTALVGDFYGFLLHDEKVRASIDAFLRDEYGVDDPGLTLSKWGEALLDARARQMPFLEATEIYSGLEGRMN
jgi:hypothetical protein